MEAFGCLREPFSKVLVSVPGSPIPLHRNESFDHFICFCGGDPIRQIEFTTVTHFVFSDRFNGLDKLLVPFWNSPAAMGSRGRNRSRRRRVAFTHTHTHTSPSPWHPLPGPRSHGDRWHCIAQHFQNAAQCQIFQETDSKASWEPFFDLSWLQCIWLWCVCLHSSCLTDVSDFLDFVWLCFLLFLGLGLLWD